MGTKKLGRLDKCHNNNRQWTCRTFRTVCDTYGECVHCGHTDSSGKQKKWMGV